MNKSFQDIQDASKENLEQLSTSAAVFSKGLQDIAADSAEFSSKSFEKGTAAIETLMASKTVDTAVEAQQAFAKASYDDFISQITKVGEMYKAAATEAFKPLEASMAAFTPAAKPAAKKSTK